MTRVNLVDPRELADQHLFAEFRELTRIPKSLWLSIERHGIEGTLRRVPQTYALGRGHVLFFYDKGLFLTRRFEALRIELRRRAYNFNEAVELDEWGVLDLDPRLMQDYTPTPEAIALSRARLAERIAQRPGWYRFTR